MKLSILVAAAVLALASGAAVGQDHPQPAPDISSPAPGPLGAYVSPQERARHQALVVGAENEVGLYCAADKVSLCADKTTPFDAYRCLNYRRSKLHADCRQAMSKLSTAMGGQPS